MKKYLLIGGFMLIAGFASAQRSTVIAALDKYKIDHKVLEPGMKAVPSDLSYDIKATNVTADKEKVILASYDASKPEGSRWTVNSVDGKAPSSSDINAFMREHGKAPAAGEVDDNTLTVESEGNGQLVVSYKVKASSLPSEAAFLKDVRTYLTINTQTKHPEKLNSKNEKPLRVKILNVDKMTVDIDYKYDNTLKRVLPVHQELDMGIKFLGRVVSMENTVEYSNFRKP